MLTYLIIGASVQFAWIVFSIVRRLPSILQVTGLIGWIAAIVGIMINIAVWPLAFIANIVVSYRTELLEMEES